jgi:hypothetical protein
VVQTFALHLGYEIFQLDIDTAYLFGNLKETIDIIQPECFDDGSGRVYLLQKSIYGLKKSMVLWNPKFPEINWVHNLLSL